MELLLEMDDPVEHELSDEPDEPDEQQVPAVSLILDESSDITG